MIEGTDIRAVRAARAVKRQIEMQKARIQHKAVAVEPHVSQEGAIARCVLRVSRRVQGGLSGVGEVDPQVAAKVPAFRFGLLRCKRQRARQD